MAYELYLPDIGEGLTEADIVQWHVQVGDPVAADQPIVAVETAKAVVDIPSPRNGVILHHGADEGATLAVGSLLVVIGDEGEEWRQTDSPTSDTSISPTDGATTRHDNATALPDRRVKAVPLIRKFARDLGVDLATVVATGPGGRVTREDVKRASPKAEPTSSGMSSRLSTTRRTIAANMLRSWNEIPHVTVWGPVDGTAMLAAMRTIGVPLEALLIEAALTALEQFPAVNALFDGQLVTTPADVNIGIAVDTEAGLMVPVVKSAQTLTREQRAAEIDRLARGAEARTLTMDELTGATFTISNVGAVGGGYGTPIIPHGTVAILSIGQAVPDVIVRDNEIVIASVFPMALSFDHRVLDGAVSSKFFAAFCEAVRTFSP
ncbi:MAG: 2-oxo acid dehydrogenase subunit E2 [Acidobacteria bacterium]|nr:2-oxo acid dehydrogenase subunit E2 [Acidobacteriota bacterium]